MSFGRGPARLILSVIIVVSTAACAWVAAVEPNRGRSWDERYSMRNVEGTLITGSLRPISPYYPSLAHLPQTAVLGAAHALHRLTGREAFAVLVPTGGVTPIGYRLARWTSVLFGAASLVLLFAVGRRLFCREVGVLAAFFLALSPWFIASSATFKPDSLLVLLTLATFWWSLTAAEEGTLRTYLLVGVGVGLATASKQNGLLACLPLVTATIPRYRKLVLWRYLAAAGLASLVVFFVLNPFPEGIAKFIWQREMYASWAKQAAVDSPRPPTLLFFPLLLTRWSWHGWVIGVAALLGLAGLSIRLLRERLRSTESVQLAMLVAFPLAFTAACGVFNSYPKENILLPVLPFTSMAAAWTVHTLWSNIAGRLESHRRLVYPALGLVALLMVGPTAWYLYGTAVPETTFDAVGKILLRSTRSIGQRTVFYEGQPGQLEVNQEIFRKSGGTKSRRRLEVSSSPQISLASVPEEILDLADFEVFPESRLQGAESRFYSGRIARPQNREVRTVAFRLFHRRGENQVVLIHPWKTVRKALTVRWRTRRGEDPVALTGKMPRKARRAEAISFDLELSEGQIDSCQLFLGEKPVALYLYASKGSATHAMSRRLLPRGLGNKMRLHCGNEALPQRKPVLRVFRWSSGPG